MATATQNYPEKFIGLGAPVAGSLSPTGVEALLRQLATLLPTDRDHARLRDRIIEANLPMAYALARRYAGRGEPIDDLCQVAAMALVKVVDRYDATRETLFVSYATPTILGEIKRHFRDSSRMIRIPRSSQDLTRAVVIATDDLSHRLARTATAADLATHLQVTAQEVAYAAAATRASHPMSFDAVTLNDGTALADMVGVIDPIFGQVDDRLHIARLIAPLDERQRRILDLRFRGNLTQAQISAEIGVSQMHVSRLLSQSLQSMRAAALEPPAVGPAARVSLVRAAALQPPPVRSVPQAVSAPSLRQAPSERSVPSVRSALPTSPARSGPQAPSARSAAPARS